MNRGLISWRTVKQQCVSLSTAESEYVALAGATQEAVWLGQLLGDFQVKNTFPMLMHEDNIAAISIASNPSHHPKTKHISIKFHYVRDQVLKVHLQFRMDKCTVWQIWQ